MMANTASAHMVLENGQKDIVDRCLEHDRAAQKQLYNQYAGGMYTLAFRITNNHELAHDSLQDAFIEVFRDLHQFKKTATLGAWIKIIVIRKATKNIRFEKRYTNLEEAQIENLVTNYNQYDSFILEKAIQNLPEGCRTVFTMVEVEGYKHKEVAHLLKINVGTSRSQLHHAKKLLQNHLKEK